jgi:hypothetical protein
MAGHGEKQSRLTEAAIAALMTSGSTIKSAAAEVGVDESTLRVWLKDPVFLSAYRAARRQVVEHAIGTGQQHTAAAFETLQRNLQSARPADQIRAAVAILDYSIRGLEVTDLIETVAVLQRELEDMKGANRNPAEPGQPPAPVDAGQEGGVKVQDVGPDTSGPGPDHVARGNVTGPVADADPALFREPDVTSL